MSLTDADRRQLSAHGIPEAEAARHLELAVEPPPPLAVSRPCTVGDGIRRLADAEIERLSAVQARAAEAGRFWRFVPASGAASRMFEALQRGDAAAHERYRAERHRLPLGELDADALMGKLAGQPKALLPFHREGDAWRTPLDEQVAEARAYAADAEGRVRLHLTGSPEHLDALKSAAARHAGAAFEWSVQSPATDVLAATPEGAPFRREDGTLLLRPGGHGALVGNLAELGGDLVYIKNIDNVQPAWARGDTLRYKRALGGLLVELQGRAHRALRAGDAAAAAALLGELGLPATSDPLSRLDRPLRVCGVVPNTGEPGGGPFWAEDRDGTPTPQIVEAAQLADPSLLAEATHFNPVDLVCGLRGPDGRPYDLRRRVDPQAVLVSRKSHGGRPLRALEHPGLWAGAMSGWNTVFVEVPGSTFTPVKTWFDLLRAEHQLAA